MILPLANQTTTETVEVKYLFFEQSSKDATSIIGPLKTTKHVAFALDAITYKTFDNSGELSTPIFHENCCTDDFEQDSNVDVTGHQEFSPPAW